MRTADAITEAERRAAEAEKALEELQVAQAPARDDLAGRRSELKNGHDGALAVRARAAAAIADVLLARYERIRRGKTPLALYALHGDACGRCYTAVPTQRRALIQRGTAIEACEACGVLLYAPE